MSTAVLIKDTYNLIPFHHLFWWTMTNRRELHTPLGGGENSRHIWTFGDLAPQLFNKARWQLWDKIVVRWIRMHFELEQSSSGEYEKQMLTQPFGRVMNAYVSLNLEHVETREVCGVHRSSLIFMKYGRVGSLQCEIEKYICLFTNCSAPGVKFFQSILFSLLLCLF